MSSKRDYEGAEEFSEPEAKRARKQHSSSSKARQHQSSSIDPTWGQKYVFSNHADATTIPAGEESDFEDDADAMAYLMSVRQQATGIPHLLVAPKTQIGPQLPDGFREDEDEGEVAEEGEIDAEADRSIYTNGIGDTRGFYEDGAYIGLEEEEGDDYEDGDAYDDAEGASGQAIHEAYFAAVLDKYLLLRETLNKQPLPGAEKRLSSSQVTYAAPFGRNSPTNRTWSQLLRNSDPSPLQVALMSKDSVVRVLRVLLGGKFLRRGHPLPERTSRWLWALLAKLPERGELNYSEIGWIRDLGRRAVLLGRSLSEMAALREELAEGGLGVNDAVDASSSDEDVVVAEPALQDDYPDTDAEDESATPAGASKKEPNAGSQPVEENAGEAMVPEPNPEGDDADEGEITDKEQQLEAAKQGLLAALEHSDSEDEEKAEQAAARERSRMNMRATLNMILTVTGEFYGQRDLLEFREPFVGM